MSDVYWAEGEIAMPATRSKSSRFNARGSPIRQPAICAKVSNARHQSAAEYGSPFGILATSQAP